jgi:hypothetical protein
MAVLAGLVGGGYYLYNRFEIRGLENLSFQPRGAARQEFLPFEEPSFFQPSADDSSGASTGELKRSWIRIAAFHFGPVDRNKMAKRDVIGSLVRVIHQFDVVAVQDIRGQNDGPLIALLDELNRAGRHYDFASAGQTAGRPGSQYGVFLYDKETVQYDPSTVYTVTDSAGRFRHTPLVASFRARGPEPSRAFTFTLISVHVQRDLAAVELNLLDDVYRAVRDDGRGEDDIILLGHFAQDERHLGQLGSFANVARALSQLPTTIRGAGTVDNLLFDKLATTEFTGRADVVDLMRELSLPLRDVQEISEHLPVWAEFSVYEGGRSDYVADRIVDSTQ